MKVRYGRVVSSLVMSAMLTALLPQVAYAAPASGGDDGKGVVDTVKGWFTGDDDGSEADPPTDDAQAVRSREKLPKGKKAPKAKRVKELKSKRTSNARFWKLSDGRVQAELSAVPTSYRDGKSWKSIDTSVHASKRKGYDFANTTNRGRSYFGSDPDHLLRYEVGDGLSVSLGLLKAGSKHLKPEAEGENVTYKDAAHGADFSYRVGPSRVKENITLDERPDSPLSFTFTLHTEGLRPKARKDGSIVFFGEAPRPVLRIPAPFMTDAKKSDSSPYGHVYSTDVVQKLTRHGDAWRLTVTPDADWLASPKRQYPVVIDPTISIAPTPGESQDVMVLSGQPSVNFAPTWNLSVGRTDVGVARSLLKFPLDDVPAGADITSAHLQVYFNQAHTTNTDDVTVEAHRATSPWTETNATWDSTSSLVGEESQTSVTVDDGDAQTAANGSWPASGSSLTQYAVGDDYHYNKDSSPGDTYTWQPEVTETGTYRVEAHYVPAFDRATNAPYTVTDGKDIQHSYTVDQTAGSGGVWTQLGSSQLPFYRGTTGKIVLGDDPASSSTAVLADAVRLVNPGQIVKNRAERDQWHKFPVADTVQKWVNGTAPNDGFVLKASDESASGPMGGPRYEAADGYYGGETSTYPRLTVTWGKVGTALDSPTVVHGTGPELHWDAYENITGDPGDDIVEYQIHRSTSQSFTPSAATLVAPVDKDATSFTDTTATPTPADDPNEIGKSYYYQIVVKTKSGELLASPSRLVGIPKAGRTMKLIQVGQTDTTLSSAKPDTNLDALQSLFEGHAWLEGAMLKTCGSASGWDVRGRTFPSDR